MIYKIIAEEKGYKPSVFEHTDVQIWNEEMNELVKDGKTLRGIWEKGGTVTAFFTKED